MRLYASEAAISAKVGYASVSSYVMSYLGLDEHGSNSSSEGGQVRRVGWGRCYCRDGLGEEGLSGLEHSPPGNRHERFSGVQVRYRCIHTSYICMYRDGLSEEGLSGLEDSPPGSTSMAIQT